LENAYKISVIISTYNSEEWLEKVLWGYEMQTEKNFELILADDGSKQPTFDLIKKMQEEVSYPIVHVWQEDDGFQKSRILNKSLVVAKSDYILMSDGDCIPRADFIEVHLKHQQKGYFLSGGYFMLPIDISKAITKEDIVSQNCFNIGWLKEKGLKASFKNQKLTSKGLLQDLLNKTTPTNASWNGHNASGWKADILNVNGFDERMQYGGQDRELGERLMNSGIKSKQIRYSAICIHLDHPRGYKNEASILKNKSIREETRRLKKTRTDFGVIKTSSESSETESMVKISAVIITFNEEEHIEKCLKSLVDVADEIVVVDSLSTDRTKTICEKYNVKFVEQAFLGYKEQKNFAIDQAAHNHILSLDGDEALSEELKKSIYKLKSKWNKDGYFVNRRNNYCGQWIKHSDWYPDRKLRLFKKGKGEWKGINPHDSYKLKDASNSGKLKGDLLHWIYRDYFEHNQKMDRFSTISAHSYLELGIKSSAWKILYRPTWAFFKSYFLRLGFLDGLNGFIICVQSAHVTFLKYIKLYQLQKKKLKHKE
tara:strand:+ start:227956 stop:229575 length:1620 start_codon:yes stop_codon:yes gene_type:complete